MNKEVLTNLLTGKKILVTGGTGSIGSAVVMRLCAYHPALIRVIARDEYKHYLLQRRLEQYGEHPPIQQCLGDIARYSDVERVMRDIDFVIHTAGMKHVSFCEDNIESAFRTNVIGAQNIVRAAQVFGVKKVVAVSTDKAVNPQSVMGSTKLLMEKVICDQSKTDGCKTVFAVARFGNVMYSRGSVLPYWRERASKGLPLFLRDPNMRRYFMPVEHAVECILFTLQTMQGGEVVVQKMEERAMIDLARAMIDQYSHDKRSEIVITGALPGEKITEELYTAEEKSRLREEDEYYIITPLL